jgi:hypothetical protein
VQQTTGFPGPPVSSDQTVPPSTLTIVSMSFILAAGGGAGELI